MLAHFLAIVSAMGRMRGSLLWWLRTCFGGLAARWLRVCLLCPSPGWSGGGGRCPGSRACVASRRGPQFTRQTPSIRARPNSAKSSSRTAEKSPAASCAHVAVWAFEPWQCTATPTRGVCTCGWPTKHSASDQRRPTRATCASTPS
uniref:Putative secreted protein n=1 Tax=Ixodes ricinus TaxID=34613 RepID=A0A6B0UUG4_IXORI